MIIDSTTLTIAQTAFLDALLGDEYAQDTGRLRNRDSLDGKKALCCMGVAADVYSKERGIPWAMVGKDENAAWTFLQETGVMPTVVAEWLDLRNPSGRVSTNPDLWDRTNWRAKLDRECAGSCNDTVGLSFKQIAALFYHRFTTGEIFVGDDQKLNSYTLQFESAWQKFLPREAR